ncbi:MAG: sugar phosphate isomerase/epimerase [Ginsengibacter sp.]
MNTSRRKFIINSSIALAGTSLLPSFVLSAGKMKEHILGIQLYTVRDDMEKDPPGTIERLKQMGYTHVEHAGYENRKFYGYSVEDTKEFLDDTGIAMLSGHSFLGAKQWDKNKNDFTDAWKYTIEDAAAVGMKYVISPGLDESLCTNMDDFKWYMDLFNKTGELCKKSGITFAYHNESYEFNHKLDNTVIYDLVLTLTDQNIVAQQIDIGNMYEPGGRPMDYLKRYPGRFMLMHVKDEIKKTPGGQNDSLYESAVLGTGVVNVKEVVDAALESGTTQFIIEQESYQGKAPLDCAEEDLKIMKGWGY